MGEVWALKIQNFLIPANSIVLVRSMGFSIANINALSIWERYTSFRAFAFCEVDGIISRILNNGNKNKGQ